MAATNLMMGRNTMSFEELVEATRQSLQAQGLEFVRFLTPDKH